MPTLTSKIDKLSTTVLISFLSLFSAALSVGSYQAWTSVTAIEQDVTPTPVIELQLSSEAVHTTQINFAPATESRRTHECDQATQVKQNIPELNLKLDNTTLY